MVQYEGRTGATSRPNITRWSIPLGLALSLLVQAGCEGGKGKPGVSYSVTVITKGPDSKVAPQATRVESTANVADAGHEPASLSYDGQSYSVVVLKTQYGKATFDVTFPDKSVHRVQVKVGEPKDILPAGQKIGVRIELQESH